MAASGDQGWRPNNRQDQSSGWNTETSTEIGTGKETGTGIRTGQAWRSSQARGVAEDNSVSHWSQGHGAGRGTSTLPDTSRTFADTSRTTSFGQSRWNSNFNSLSSSFAGSSLSTNSSSLVSSWTSVSPTLGSGGRVTVETGRRKEQSQGAGGRQSEQGAVDWDGLVDSVFTEEIN